jgi:uncharacterized protein (DUF1015 family)
MDTEQVGILFPEILIPDKKINKQKWPVIACDQFTSNEDYWIKTSRTVGGAPSTLHIIVPEAHLTDPDVEERIGHAKQTMSDYIEDGVLVRLPQGAMLVERETPFGTRIGLVLAVDLEKYEIDYRKKPLIRATEQTVAERLPIRMRLREGSVIECPHVMLLIDDLKDTVIGPVYDAKDQLPKMYDTPLMMGGGHLKGWFVEEPTLLNGIVSALEQLKRSARDGMLFAVGDGNHSLASAKGIWDQHKAKLTEEERENDPLRYALVEVVNLYDNGITMHPIHRVLFNVDVPVVLNMLVSILNKQGQEASMIYTRGTRIQPKEGVQIIRFESKMSKGHIEVRKPKHDILTQTLTLALDTLLEQLPRARVDYIHGDEELHNLVKGHSCLGFLMEPMRKDELFDAVVTYGVLPRKAFSMGVAEEKRYYYECRLLVNASGEEAEPEPEESLPTEMTEPEISESVDSETPESDVFEIETSEAPEPEDKIVPAAEEWAEDDAAGGLNAEDDEELSRMAKRPKWRLFGKRKNDEGM